MIRRVVAFLLLAVCTVGCGYSTDSLMPAGAQRVAVAAFENDTEWRGVEMEFTRRLCQELTRRAGVTLVEQRSADAVLHGRITGVRRSPLAEGVKDITIEEGVAVVVEFTLEDPRSGTILAGPFRIVRRAEALTARGETPQHALFDAARLCARDAVDRICAEHMKSAAAR
ncbi:MAG: hypothetical protein EXS14_02390 [Planctomycetes bacterium]|nr:hypothetical protein [Planctomycetota bacterium]